MNKLKSLLPENSPTFKFSISGLRGVFGKDLTPENIIAITKAFHFISKKGAIAIAQDTRASSLTIYHLIVGSLTSLGRMVHNLEIIPTPTLKAYVKDYKLAGGIMITASHNPKEYNGLKMVNTQGEFFNEATNQQLLQNIRSQSTQPQYNVKKIGCIENKKEIAIQNHVEQVIKKIPINIKNLPKSLFPIALDTLGATATEIAAYFFKRLNIPYVSMYPHFLTEFPRKPEPVSTALKKFSKFILEKKAGLGFAFDPDADRLVVVNQKGIPIGEENTLSLALFQGCQILQKKPSKNIVINFSSSWRNYWVAKKFNYHLHRAKVGELNVVESMKNKKAILGGEGNGGVIDPAVSSYGRDSLVAIAYILSLLSTQKMSLDSILNEFPTTYMKKLAIPITKKKFNTSKVLAQIKKQFPDYQINKEDGIFISTSKGIPWAHVRASNTEPIIRIILESENLTEMKNMEKQLHQCL